MKRLNNLWQPVISFDNLLSAYYQARRGKQHKSAVAEFTLHLESELFTLQQQLTDGSYQPGEYQLFTLYERKPRLIAAAPFRDRVVHHALMNIVEPPIDKQFIYDSYACRRSKGVHKAVARYQNWAKRYHYALKMDIQQYFPSVNLQLLKQKLRHRIKDAQVLNLFDKIIDSSPAITSGTGLPIGNLTSQFLANLYLDDFDHYVKEQLHIKAYLRYVDDFMVLDDDKKRLHQLRQQIQDYLLVHNRLRLHPNKAHIVPTHLGVDVLGYVVYPNKRLLRNDNGHRFIRKLRKLEKNYSTDKTTYADIKPHIMSWIGHAKHANTYGLRRQIFANVVWRKKSTANDEDKRIEGCRC